MAINTFCLHQHQWLWRPDSPAGCTYQLESYLIISYQHTIIMFRNSVADSATCRYWAWWNASIPTYGWSCCYHNQHDILLTKFALHLQELAQQLWRPSGPLQALEMDPLDRSHHEIYSIRVAQPGICCEGNQLDVNTCHLQCCHHFAIQKLNETDCM